jgi:hypothetical protein
LIGSQKVAQLFRIELLGQIRGTHQIAKDDGDLPALSSPRDPSRGAWVAAGTATGRRVQRVTAFVTKVLPAWGNHARDVIPLGVA